MAFTQDFRTQRRNYNDGETRIGEKDRLWYDSNTNSIRISDGVTPGGVVVGGGGGGSNYTLPTATTTIKGGVKIDGTTIAINGSGVISVGSVPYSSITSAPTVPTKVSDLTNDTGFITGVSWDSVTNKPTLFSGAYADLSGKPTAVSAFTNDSGYLTSSSLSSYATQSYVTSRGYITSSSLPTAVSELTNDSGYLTESNFDLNTIDYDSNNNLHATGILPGDTDGFTAIFAGRAAGIAALPNTVIQSQAQVNDYAQNNFQNTNDGTHASTEWVATSPNGSDTEYYIDLGINGASWDGTAENSLYDNVGQRDGWLYVQGGNAGGGNLILGTSIANTYTKIIAGDVSTGDREVARFSSTEVKLSKQLTFSDNTTQTTAWPGTYSYNDLTDTPTLVTSYNDLTDLPTLVTSYNQLTNLPSLFSGAYADLTGKPTLFSGSYNDLTDTPVTVQTLGDLTDVDLTTPPTIGQVLKYDGTKWAPGTDITSGGAGTDADTLDGFDSSYFLNYNNFTNKPTIPTTVTINGTALTLDSSGTITANTTNALTIGYGLTGTSTTFNGSAANTVKLDTSSTAVTATSGGTLTLSAATLTRNYVVTGGATGGTYTIKLPDLTTLNVGQQITFFTTASLIAWQLSTGTSIVTNANSGSVARATTFTVISNAANTTANLAFTALPITGSTVGSGTALVTNNGPFITNLGTNSVDNSNAGLSVGPSSTSITVSATTGTFTHTLNLATAPTAATYTKTINVGTNLNGGTGTINIGTGVTSGTSTLNLGSTSTTTTMNGAVTITSLTATNSIVGSITGNAATATKLGTARAINGVNFDGSAAITITASTPNALTIGSGLSGTSFDGSTAVTIAVDSTVALRADTHYIGTTSIALNRASASQTLTGVSIDGNAATVTNGVYTSGTYANPSWITSLAYSKLTGTPSLFSGSYTDLTNKPTIYSTAYIGTTSLDFTRASASQTLTGVSIDGNAATVTNGLYSTSSYSNPSWLTSLAYSKLTGAPTVPTNVSELTNDSGFITDSVTTLSSLTSVGTLTGLTVNSTSDTPLSITAQGRPGSETNTWSFVSNQGIGGPGSWIEFPDGSLQTTAYTGNAATVTNGVYTTDTGTVTNTMLAGSIANAKLANSSITVNGSSISLGGTATITAANPNALTIGTGLSGTSYTGSAAVTIAIDSTVATLTGAQTLLNKNINGSNNTITNIANSSLSNSSITVGTTAISLGSSSTTLGGMAWITFAGSTSGTTQLRPSAIAGTTTVTMPGTTGTLITTGDTGTVTNAMLAGSIANNKLANSSVTVNGTSISLGGSGTISVNSIGASGFSTVLGFDGAGNLILSNGTMFRAPSGLTIETGSPTFKDWTFSTTGTLTFPDATVQSTAYTGNAATVTNGVYTTGSYSNPSWITSLAGSKVTNAVLTTDTGTVTNTMLAGSIANDKLAHSSITIGATSVTLGGSIASFGGVTSIDATLSASSFFATPNETVNLFAGAATVNIGKTSGTIAAQNILTIPEVASVTDNSATTKYLGIGTHGQLFDDGNLHLHTSSSTLWINSLDSGDIQIGTQYNSGSGSDVYIGKNLAANSGSITANATTSFIAGSNAVSGVALQMPSESALRNLTNGATNMYFDVSIGGSTTGGFQFRSGSSYTNFMTLDSNGPKSITPYKGKTSFNVALDTVVTVDNLKYRISNSGGIFPQIASASGSQVDVCYDVLGVVSGAGVTSAQNSGYLLAANGTWLSIYSSHGMDTRGDRLTAHITDKAGEKIYRVTFMVTNNSGNATGYNIVVERIL